MSFTALAPFFVVAKAASSRLRHLQQIQRRQRLLVTLTTICPLMMTCLFYVLALGNEGPALIRWSQSTPPPPNRLRFLTSHPVRMPHLIICSRELEQLTVGGAGVVVADTARALTLSGQWRVTMLLDLPAAPPSSIERQKQYRRLDAWRINAADAWSAPAAADGGVSYRESKRQSILRNIRLALLTDWAGHPKDDNILPLYWRNSLLWAHGLHALHAKERFDAVEFFDYEAPAYHTLLWRLIGDGGVSSHAVVPIAGIHAFQVWIRTHGLLQLIDDVENQRQRQNEQKRETEGKAPIAGLSYVYRMESRALQLADAVIANSPSIGRDYARRQQLDSRRVLAITPTLGTLESYPSLQSNHDDTLLDPVTHTNILVYGKLQRVKGADVAARAIVQVMRELQSEWRGVAIFTGDDLPCVSDPSVNTSACILRSAVPIDLRSRFKFTGTVKRGEIGTIAAANDVRLAILPSRYETFCLAAHELKHYGVPLVLPDLPAYRDYFVDGVNALLFEPGSTGDLERVLVNAVTNDVAIRRIRRAPPFDYGDPVQGYARLMEE